ncbi:hypothetical protein V493_02859 [Pseudogymnoascus sp. VKM F-4281 (FW-2241)]|nr:hypothetical protein V493_02859 [Pseudogymnoascus sp. VKM F-4281 (FW-2241)]
MALPNDIVFEQPNQPEQAKSQETGLPNLSQDGQKGPSQQWVLPPLPQECELPQWELPTLHQQEGGSKTPKRRHSSFFEKFVSPFGAHPGLDKLSLSTRTDLPEPHHNTFINGALGRPEPPSYPYVSSSCSDYSSTRSISPDPDRIRNVPTFLVTSGSIFPAAPPGSVDGVPGGLDYRRRPDGAFELCPPETRPTFNMFFTVKRRGPVERGRQRIPVVSITLSTKISESETRPILGLYRSIRDARGQPVFRAAEHDREGLAGMIGITREEWNSGLRTPVYEPPSWMSVDQLSIELTEGVVGEDSNRAAISTPPDLGGEDAMDIDSEEGSTWIAGPVEPTSRASFGVAVGRSDGTADAPIYIDSGSAWEDESGESESLVGWREG